MSRLSGSSYFRRGRGRAELDGRADRFAAEAARAGARIAGGLLDWRTAGGFDRLTAEGSVSDGLGRGTDAAVGDVGRRDAVLGTE